MEVAGPVVQCEGVSKRYGDNVAVDGLSFTLEPGEILSVLGTSGCGKTTMLRLVAGFEAPDSGEISIRGRLVSNRSKHIPPENRNVGMVFQEYALFPHMTVSQNVSFGLQGLTTSERRKRLSEVLGLVRLTGLEGRYPNELSGGQQQRVALARTLAPRPVTILLDEPFSNLDAGMRSDVRQEMEHILRENGIATVFVTHDREQAFAMADRIGIMVGGRLDQLDTPDVIYHSPATTAVARVAGTFDLLRGKASSGGAMTEVGTLRYATRNETLPEGTPVELLVHSDDFQVGPDSASDIVVISREFRGDQTILTVRLPSGDTLRCRHRSYSTLVPGTRVKLTNQKDIPFVAFKSSGDRV